MELFVEETLYSVVLVAVVAIYSFIFNFILKKVKRLSRESKRKFSVNNNFFLTIITILAFGVIWAGQIQAFTLSFLAIGAAVVLATKEIIMCITGTFYQSVSQPFLIGDHIEIGELRGQVISRGIFSTKILEIGPGNKTHQFTGRLVTLPNSSYLLKNVLNESYLKDFVLHTFLIPTPYNVDTDKIENMLIEICEKHVEVYYKDAEAYIEKFQQRANLETPKIKARINIKVSSHEEIQFIVRVTIPVAQKGTVQQRITKDFLDQKHVWLPS